MPNLRQVKLPHKLHRRTHRKGGHTHRKGAQPTTLCGIVHGLRPRTKVKVYGEVVSQREDFETLGLTGFDCHSERDAAVKERGKGRVSESERGTEVRIGTMTRQLARQFWGNGVTSVA